ncbi:hypothetical protein BGLT_07386 [Caballeronia glathei]|nr:hypothetical protein BGLT_07386 [Caballeronia glathei]
MPRAFARPGRLAQSRGRRPGTDAPFPDAAEVLGLARLARLKRPEHAR